MLKNYLKIAFRNLRRNKVFSAINIFGLAIGIATCLLIMLFVANELSFDRYNKKADRIVRVVFRGTVQGEKMKEANVFPPVAAALLRDYPEVEEATRLSRGGSQFFSYGEKSFKENGFVYADSNFFQVFTLPFLKGNKNTALVQPNTIVITKSTAEKYFGKDNPLGKVVNIKAWNSSFKVTGVIDNIPMNSHFHFDICASFAGFADSRSQSWMSSNYFTYLVLRKGYDYKKLESKLPQEVEKYMGPQLQEQMGMSLSEFRQKGNDIGLFLQPLTDIHLHSDMSPNTELEPGGDIQYVYIFGAIALFMLLIACINFMNLSTAGASKRAREVGIRKVLGSLKLELVRQFLFESVMMTFVSLLLAVFLVYFALPLFNHLSGKNLELNLISSFWILPCLLVFGLLTGILAGSYPAFFLSAFNPISVLKGTLTAGKKSIGLRSSLVVFQFFISTVLIIGTIVVYKQLNYIQNKKLGYNKNQVIVLEQCWLLGKGQDAFRQQVLRDPRVLSLSASDYLPAGPTDGNNFFVYDKNKLDQIKTLRYEVDPNYVPTLGIEMKEGRNFSKDFATDSLSVILNETAVRAFGWGENALGKTVTTSDEQNKVSFRVIGVVKDFHFKSLHERISPLVMVFGHNSGTLIIKAQTPDVSGLLTSLKKNWSSFRTESPLVYSFLNERFMETYLAEHKAGTILAIFAGLTIFVACLGLFGLAMFTAEQRTKEIGIRKVLGASVSGVVGLLSQDFLKLVLIANIIAWPLGWWIMNKWLQDFAYRINISWWIFVIAGIFAVLIAIVTISFQAVKAALSNPVKSLKTE